jgi:hypothetical protein
MIFQRCFLRALKFGSPVRSRDMLPRADDRAVGVAALPANGVAREATSSYCARLIRPLRSVHAAVSGPSWMGTVLVAWLATRVVLFLVAEGAIYIATKLHFHRLEPGRHSADSVTAFLSSWDGAWYNRIARYGYPTHFDPHHFSAIAFFPLLPELLHLTISVGLPAQSVMGLVLVNLIALGALITVAALTESVMGTELAGRTSLYLAISPMGFVLGMLYTEALLLACAFGALALVLRNRPWLALPLALGAGLCRPTGILIMIPLAYLAYRGDGQRLARSCVLLMPAVGLGLFMTFLWIHVGDPFAFAHAEIAWGRSAASADEFSQSLAQIGTSLIRGVVTDHHRLWLARDAVGGVLSLALLIYGWRRGIPWWWLIFGLATIVLPLVSGSMMSLARFGLFCIPAFWALAMLGRRACFDQAYLIIASSLFAVGELLLLARWP